MRLKLEIRESSHCSVPGHLLPGVFLLLTTAVGCNTSLAIFMMCMVLGSAGLIGVGGFANNLDVAGRYAGNVKLSLTSRLPEMHKAWSLAGVTFGISTALGCTCSVVAAHVAGIITQGSVSAVIYPHLSHSHYPHFHFFHPGVHAPVAYSVWHCGRCLLVSGAVLLPI